MDWQTLKADIAAATGRSSEAVPRPGTHEFFALMGELQETHPDIAQKIQAYLSESAHPQPLRSEAEIMGEARRARARQGLLRLFTKRDPTQPPRTRTNKTRVVIAAVLAIVVLWAIGRMHSTPLPTPSTAHTPAASRPAPATAQRPPAQVPGPAAGASASGPSGGTTLPEPPLPAQPAGFPTPTTPGPALHPGVPTGATASATGITVVAPAAAQAPKLLIAAPKADAGVTTVVSAVPLSQGQGTRAVEGVTIVSPSAPEKPDAGAIAGGQQAAVPPPSFRVGDQFTVKLLTPLAVSPAWQSIPAVAQGVDGPLSGWRVVGTASLGQDGSVQITWTQALSPDGKTTLQLHGVAYDPSVGKPGVPGAQTGVMAPQAARTALSGSLAAIAQYVQDQITAQQTQVAGLTATVTSQVPPFWQVLAQQLATGFQPAPVQTGGTVMVAHLPAGAPIVVFITAPTA